MGYTLTPFAVDLRMVTAVIGSRDRNLLNSLVRKFSEELEEIDALDEDFDESDEVAEFADGEEGLQQFTASLRDAFTPFLEAVQQGAVPERSPAGGEPSAGESASAPDVRGAASDEKADADDEDEPPLTGVPEELNSPGKLDASLMDAVTRLFRGEELDPDHPIARVIAEEPELAEGNDESASGSGERHASMRDVMRHLIMGEECDRRVGFKYGYALEFLCRHFGELLSNEHWSFRSGASYGWFRKIDKALKSLGLPKGTMRVADHIENRGSPIPIPPIADFPSIGYMTRAEIREAANALDHTDLTALKPGDLRDSLAELHTWFQICSQADRDLVCFYY